MIINRRIKFNSNFKFCQFQYFENHFGEKLLELYLKKFAGGEDSQLQKSNRTNELQHTVNRGLTFESVQPFCKFHFSSDALNARTKRMFYGRHNFSSNFTATLIVTVLLLLNIVWILLFPLLSITTGELKPRGLYVDENSILVHSELH
jgi:hypothetical protein